MEQLIKVDFHLHTQYSKDSLTSLSSLLERARQLQMGKLVITDHNTIRGALELWKQAPDYVIIGEEILTTSGEILAFFVKEEIPKGICPEEAVKRLKEQGAFISLSHPYAFSRHGWHESEMERLLPYLDAIEVKNARNRPAQNEKARAFALDHGLCGTAGSDSHGLPEFGRMGLSLPFFWDAESLRKSIRSAETFGTESSPLVRFYSRKAVLYKKLGIK